MLGDITRVATTTNSEAQLKPAPQKGPFKSEMRQLVSLTVVVSDVTLRNKAAEMVHKKTIREV